MCVYTNIGTKHFSHPTSTLLFNCVLTIHNKRICCYVTYAFKTIMHSGKREYLDNWQATWRSYLDADDDTVDSDRSRYDSPSTTGHRMTCCLTGRVG